MVERVVDNKNNELSEFIKKLYDLKNSEIDSNVQDITKLRLVDWLGGYLASQKEAPINEISSLFFEQEKGSTVFLTGKKYEIRNTAFINGYLGHFYELDDVHKEAIMHPGAIIFPVALSVAEQNGALTYKEFLKIIIAGYEFILKLGSIINPSHYKYFHTTGTIGTLASAFIYSIVKHNDVNKTISSVNMSTTMSSGLVSAFGYDSKLVTVGHACMAGILAGELTGVNLTSNSNAFTSSNGYYKAFTNEDKLNNLHLIDSDNLEICNTYVKMHASCGHTHSAIDALSSIVDSNNIDLDEINNIKVYTYKVAKEITEGRDYSSRQLSQFSNPFCLSLLLLTGRISIVDFDNYMKPEELNKIIQIADKIEIIEDESYTLKYPRLRASRVTVLTDEGEYSSEKLLPNKYDSEKEIIEKFKFLLVDMYSGEDIDEMLNLILYYQLDHPVSILIEKLQKSTRR